MIPLLFNERKGNAESMMLKRYPIETVLAEKLETILRLGTMNSRMKDFYDLHLMLSDPRKPSNESCFDAFNKTWLNRHDEPLSEALFIDWYFILNEIETHDDV